MLATSTPTIGRYDDFFTPEALALQRSTPWNDFTSLIRTMHTAIHDFLSDVLIEPRINGMKMSGSNLRALVYATRALGRIVKFHNEEHPPLSYIQKDMEDGTWMGRRKLGIESTLNIWPKQTPPIESEEPECHAPPNPTQKEDPPTLPTNLTNGAPPGASPATPTPSNMVSTLPDSASP
jgi:hypothetical protein